MKAVLIITEAMRPFTNDWGSTQRVYFYSRELVANNYKVFIICKNKSTLSPGLYNCDGVNVVSFDNPVDNDTKSDKKNLKSKIIVATKKNKFILTVLRCWYRFLYSEPNLFCGKKAVAWAKRNKNAIIDFIYENHIDVVILSGPPFGIFHLSSEIKKTGVKLVLDYRDPWGLWYEKWSLSTAYEKQAIRLSNLVIASTNPLACKFKQYYKANAFAVLNGYDATAWANISTKKPKNSYFTISYIGYISINNPPPFRDPTVFLSAAIEFLQTHKDAVVRFIGVGDNLCDIRFKNENLFFKNSVPNIDALNLISESDLLISIHTAHDKSGSYIICGKIYDYIRSGNRILSIGDNAFCNEELIKKTNAGAHVKNNKKDILLALQNEYDLWKKGINLRNDGNYFEEYSRQFQNKLLVGYINEVIEGDK